MSSLLFFEVILFYVCDLMPYFCDFVLTEMRVVKFLKSICHGSSKANKCFLNEEEETVDGDQLLIHCSKARLLWDLLLAIVDVK